MKVRPLLFVRTFVLLACSPAAPGEPPTPTAAVCRHLIGADDSSLIAHAPLWILDSTASLSIDQERLLANIRSSATTAELHVARLSPDADSLLQLGNSVVLTVAPGRAVIAVGRNVTRRGPSDVSWIGAIENEFGHVSLVLSTIGVTGSLQSVARESLVHASYRVAPLGGGLQAVICVDPSKCPPD